MKNLTISLVAAWVATIRTFQDGDIFRESQIDLYSGDIADRLGWLKTNKADLSAANTWTATQTFSPSGLVAAIFNKQISFGGGLTGAWLEHRVRVLGDANETPTLDAELYIVPQITANRTYTFGSYGGNPQRRIRIIRQRTADAFTVTVSNGTTVAVIAASKPGWVELQYSTTNGWLQVAYSVDVSPTFVAVSD